MKNTEQLLRPICNNSTTRKSFALKMIALMILAFTGCGTSTVDKNNSSLNDAIKSINADEIALNDVVPFEWDMLYTFAPYMPKTEIQEIIGFTSNDIKETVSEGMTQLLFVKNDEVVCSICGYSENLGYAVLFETEETYSKISYEDNAIFEVKREGNVTLLSVNVLEPQQYFSAEDFSQIEIGTSRDEILSKFGEPTGGLHGLFGDVYLTDDDVSITVYYDAEANVSEIQISSDEIPLESIPGDLIPMVFVNDTMYFQSRSQQSYAEIQDGFDYLGKIESEVAPSQKPSEELQANHGIFGAEVYQYGEHIVVLIGDKYWLYEYEVTNNLIGATLD